MPAGATVHWLGRILHGAGTNTTDRWREGLVVSWAVDWICQEANQYMDIPVEKAKDLDPKVRVILGYSSSGGLGHYDHMRTNTPKSSRPPKGPSKQ